MTLQLRRRGFLGALLGLTAAPVLARLPLLEVPPSIQVVETPLILPPLQPTPSANDINYITSIYAWGNAPVSTPGLIRVLRQNTPNCILQLPINLCGGMLYWKPAPDAYIISLPDLEAVFDLSPGVEVTVVWQRGRHHYAQRLSYSSTGEYIPLEVNARFVAP